MQVAIDGPAGSGKSTVCKIIASKYGFTYIDTGAMYRSIAYVAENFGYDDIEKKAAEVEFILEDNGKKISIRYNGETIDLTTKIRTPEISSKVAFIASNKEIRKILVAKQQSYAKGCDVIMEGRDITTVVLPEADIKVNRANINQIQTSLQSSRIDLENSIIRSPIDGIILERSVSLGQTVAANFQTPTLFTLAENLKAMKLVVNISESDIGKVREGQDVAFSVDAYPNVEFHAKVEKVNFAATTTDNITSYETTILVDNEKLLLKPGMNATASIKVESQKNMMLVPVAAIFYNPQQQQQTNSKNSSNPFMIGPPPRPRQQKATNTKTENYTQGEIWILENSVAKPVSVEVGISDSRMVAIKSEAINLDSSIIVDSKLN